MQVVCREWAGKAFFAVRRAAAVAVVGSVVAACVAPFPPELQAENHNGVAKVLANAYEEVTENYVDRVDVADLAVAGLTNLSRLEPAFSIQADAQVVSLRLRDEEIFGFSRPPADDVDGWADAAADTLIAAREHSGMVRAISAQRVFENQMEGIAGSLKGGARYSQPYEWREILMPEYDGGVIISVKILESGLEIWRLDPDGRLEAEGLKKGDTITHIDFAPIAGLSWRDVRKRLMGPAGSTLAFTVLRGDPSAPTDLRVTRWKAEAPSYRLTRHDDIAVLQVPYLNFRATYELERGIGTELRKARYGETALVGLVLDLRGNLGGGDLLLTDLANSFLGKGVISIQHDYRPEPKKVINASWPDHSDKLPLVVLVDGFTGYGVEDVVAALQDNGRALVIGSSTLGDGVVMQNVSLFNMGSIWMPVAFSHAPSGYGLAGRGVLPDICTSTPGASIDGLMASLRRQEGLANIADRTRNIDPEDKEALVAQRALCPAVLDEGDLALDLALAILEDPDLYARMMTQNTGP
jgi:carboxyl-terminal processing protease